MLSPPTRLTTSCTLSSLACQPFHSSICLLVVSHRPHLVSIRLSNSKRCWCLLRAAISRSVSRAGLVRVCRTWRRTHWRSTWAARRIATARRVRATPTAAGVCPVTAPHFAPAATSSPPPLCTYSTSIFYTLWLCKYVQNHCDACEAHFPLSACMYWHYEQCVESLDALHSPVVMVWPPILTRPRSPVNSTSTPKFCEFHHNQSEKTSSCNTLLK